MAGRKYSAKSAPVAREAFSLDEQRVLRAMRQEPARLRARLEWFAQASSAERAAWPAELPMVLACSGAVLRELERREAPTSHAWIPALLRRVQGAQGCAGV